MKCTNISEGTLLPDANQVNRKISAPRRADRTAPASPVVNTPAGTLLRFKRTEIMTRVVTFSKGDCPSSKHRAYMDTLHRAGDGRLFLVRDSWAGRQGDCHRRRHSYNVRRIGAIAALLWMLGGIYDGAMPQHLKRDRVKFARQFWATINGKGGVS